VGVVGQFGDDRAEGRDLGGELCLGGFELLDVLMGVGELLA
jgi:hypothetical protein